MSRGPSPSAPRHWGWPLFALASLLAAAAFIPNIPPLPRPWTGTLLAAGALLPWVSFPRIPNYRLLFAVTLSAAAGGLAYAGALPPSPDRAWEALWITALTCLALTPTVPLRTRSGGSLRWLGASLAGAAILFLLYRVILPWLAERAPLWAGLGEETLFELILGALALGLSLGLGGRDFGLGGGLAGLAALALLLARYPDPERRDLPLSAFALLLAATAVYVWVYRLRFRVSYDPLMQIYNRAHADQILHAPPADNLGAVGAVAMVDLDHFKHLNDRHGHAMGDKVLFEAAQAIRQASLPSGICCRYGGEEIIVFLPQTGEERAGSLFEGIRAAVEKIKLKDGRRSIHPTCSIGWSPVSGDSDKPLSYFVEKADQALYKAKDQGRNRVVRA